jgi:hypothetical protein
LVRSLWGFCIVTQASYSIGLLVSKGYGVGNVSVSPLKAAPGASVTISGSACKLPSMAGAALLAQTDRQTDR